jgi:hypothetical protein
MHGEKLIKKFLGDQITSTVEVCDRAPVLYGFSR